MKKIYLLLFAVLAVLQLSAQDRVTQIREKTDESRPEFSNCGSPSRRLAQFSGKLFRGNRQCR